MNSRLVDAGLERLGADALLVLAESSRDPDLASFTGSAHLGEAFVLKAPRTPAVLGFLVDMERDEAAATGMRLAASAREAIRLRAAGTTGLDIWTGILSAALADAGLDGATVAVAGRLPLGLAQPVLGALEARGYRFVGGHDLARRARKPKSERELESIRLAARGTCLAFRRVAEILASAAFDDGDLRRNGRVLTAGDLRREIAVTLAGSGLEQPDGNIVATGADAGVPHTRGSDAKQLRSGEAILVDLYPKGSLYADCTRTFCVGEPPADLSLAHALCREVLAKSVSLAVPGAAGADLQSGACDLFEGAGFETTRSAAGTRSGYVHGLGHGVGYELHEYPSFRRGSAGSGMLGVDDVFTIEPGLYDPGAGYGVRLEDLFVMGSDGPEVLTPLPYDLDPRAW